MTRYEIKTAERAITVEADAAIAAKKATLMDDIELGSKTIRHLKNSMRYLKAKAMGDDLSTIEGSDTDDLGGETTSDGTNSGVDQRN